LSGYSAISGIMVFLTAGKDLKILLRSRKPKCFFFF